MPKKIASIEDYLGLEKTKFEQMQEDAEFYKTAQDKLSKARRALKSGDKLFEGYTAETSSQQLPPLSSAPSLFLTGILDYKCTTLDTNEDYKNDKKQLTDELETYSYQLNNAVRTKTSENHEAYSTDQCLNVFKKYEEFCRKCKQKIKDAFEQKMKQFSKEKTKLKALNGLIEEFNQSKGSDKIITAWQNVRDWYQKNKPSSSAKSGEKPVTQVYNKALEIAKKIVPTAIENCINDESEAICDTLQTIRDKKLQQPNVTQMTTIRKGFLDRIKSYNELYSELSDTDIATNVLDKYINQVEDKWNEVFPT